MVYHSTGILACTLKVDSRLLAINFNTFTHCDCAFHDALIRSNSISNRFDEDGLVKNNHHAIDTVPPDGSDRFNDSLVIDCRSDEKTVHEDQVLIPAIQPLLLLSSNHPALLRIPCVAVIHEVTNYDSHCSK